MYKYAEMLYGKIRAIYEDARPFDAWKEIHSPSLYWIDVTGMECNVGDVVSFQDGVGLVITAPPAQELTLDELKALQIQVLKEQRDAEEVSDIEYKFNFFDFDEKSRDRINAAIVALGFMDEGATIDWTTADDENVPMTADDLKQLIAEAAKRSNLLHVKYRQLRDLVNSYGEEDKDKIKEVVW